PDFAKTRGMEALLKHKVHPKGGCYGCPMACFNMVEVNEGKYAGLKVSSGTFVSSVLEFGGKCAIDNLPAIWNCKEITHRLGMDYGSASGSIALAMELNQRGIITKEDADYLDLSWGNEETVVKMLHKIAYREGFGAVFADGNVTAAERIGKGARDYVMTIKGLDMMWADPRSCTRAFSFSYLTSPRGGDNVKTNHSLRADIPDAGWPIEKWDMDPEIKRRAYGSTPFKADAMKMEGKGILNKWFDDATTVTNLLVTCFFPTVSLLAIGPTHWAKLLSACTGRDISGDELMAVGDKVFTLQRAYLARAGITRKDDDWPERFYREALPEGPAKGARLTREMTNKYLDEYYEARGWDKATGLPGKKKLVAVGLKDVANDLARRGKL
ncbi:MAG: aldehyde ferredoxin oxidoreductase C-terminal domain-containing protein, partial [bacterium]|nr:aldehyde ferredoxin oxidoreductase C-terminal domain-containing protein [bacterium]